MDEQKTIGKISLHKYLLWPMVIGIIIGLLSITAVYYNAPMPPALKFSIWLLTIIPLMPIVSFCQLFLHLEGEAMINYVLLSPLVWAIIGMAVGYVSYRLRLFFKNYSRQGEIAIASKDEQVLKKMWLVALAVFSTVIVTVFFMNNQNTDTVKSVEKKPIVNQIKISEQNQQSVASQNHINDVADVTGNSKEKSAKVKTPQEFVADKQTRLKILDDLTWKKYNNKEFGVAFDYPADWEISTPEYFQPGEFYIKITKLGETGSDLIPDALNFRILGTKQNFVPDHPTSIIGGCAYEYKNVSEFCQSGCIYINNEKAISLKEVNRGEPIKSLVGYTSLNKEYPRLSFEMNIDEFVFKISQEEGISPDELYRAIDFEDESGDENLPPELFEAVTIFRHMAESLSSVY